MADRREHVAFLNLTSFAGAVPGASHWYASIWFDRESIDLDHVITVREAAAMNKSDNRWSRLSTWTPGDETSRYRSKEDAIKTAKEKWQEIAPEAKVLVEGENYVAEPQPILDGLPAETMDKLNDLCQRCEDLGWWEDGNSDEVEEISQDWFAVLSEALKGKEQEDEGSIY